MTIVTTILTGIVLPIFALMGVGVLADRTLKPDLATLSKLNFYILAPALVFTKLYGSTLEGAFVAHVMAFNTVHLLVLLAFCHVAYRMRPLREHRSLLTLGTLFNNSGNYGLPFAQLAFGDAGVAVMALTLVFQNVTSFTLGLWLIGDERLGWWARLRAILKTPMIHALIAAALCNAFNIHLPRVIEFPLAHLSDALVPIALFTLGVQLSRSQWAGNAAVLSAVTAGRLVVAPLAAALLAAVWNMVFPGAASAAMPVLICGASLPVAVNVYILAREYDREPELASRMVFWTTLVSAVTVTVWLALYG